GVLPWQAGAGWPLALQAGPWGWSVGAALGVALVLAFLPGARKARAGRVAAAAGAAFGLLAGGLALAGWTLGLGMAGVGFALVF
ncbi:hypothetical protein OFN55_38920, partial [Escherichia coli]|nr:hypothetical protein [Escherichia coli]